MVEDIKESEVTFSNAILAEAPSPTDLTAQLDADIFQTEGIDNDVIPTMPEISSHFRVPVEVIGKLISTRIGRVEEITHEELVNDGLYYLYEGEQLLTDLKRRGEWVNQNNLPAERAFLLSYV